MYLARAHKNRSPLIRVPNFGGRKNAARCEIRNPDGAVNPYLVRVLLATGLDGIRNRIDPGDPVELNVYQMTYEEEGTEHRFAARVLQEALDEFETSDLMGKRWVKLRSKISCGKNARNGTCSECKQLNGMFTVNKSDSKPKSSRFLIFSFFSFELSNLL